MARALNGLHWQSPLGSGTQGQINQGAGFGSVLILSHSGVPPAGEQTAKDQIYWLERNMTCSSTSVAQREIVRLYYPGGATLPAATALADLWKNLVQWCQGQGVYYFQVLNEPDAEYPGQLWSPTNATYMNALADAIKARGTGGPMYLGFPGPSEGIPHYSANWTTYWNAYASSVNSHYDWIALHPYATTFQGLKDDAYGQATKIHTLFPSRPVRFTEYGIPIDGEPAGNHSTRGGFYRDFVTWLRSGWCDYVYAAHVFIGRDSSGDDTARFQLTDAEAAIITNGVGCVGQ